MDTDIRLSPRVAAIVGALVADSAALGLHWLYDSKRIAEIEQSTGLVFLQPESDHYADAKGFFAHGGKAVGDASAYGEICLLMLKYWAEQGEFQRVQYQTEFRNHFGPGGAYTGYVDTATRLTLLKLIPLVPEDFPEISGADDDQFAALAAVPVITATHNGSREALLEKIEQIVRLTHHHADAVAAARYTACVLAAVLDGEPVKQALTQSLVYAGDKLTPLLEEALNTDILNSVAAAERFGMACHVLEGVPVIAHILRHATSYQQAVQANIQAGGDSCGRSIMLGAIAAAQTALSGGDDTGIPFSWLAKYKHLPVAADACTRLSLGK